MQQPVCTHTYNIHSEQVRGSGISRNYPRRVAYTTYIGTTTTTCHMGCNNNIIMFTYLIYRFKTPSAVNGHYIIVIFIILIIVIIIHCKHAYLYIMLTAASCIHDMSYTQWAYCNNLSNKIHFASVQYYSERQKFFLADITPAMSRLNMSRLEKHRQQRLDYGYRSRSI